MGQSLFLSHPGSAHSPEAEGGLGGLDTFDYLEGKSASVLLSFSGQLRTRVSWEMDLQAPLSWQRKLEQANTIHSSFNLFHGFMITKVIQVIVDYLENATVH